MTTDSLYRPSSSDVGIPAKTKTNGIAAATGGDVGMRRIGVREMAGEMLLSRAWDHLLSLSFFLFLSFRFPLIHIVHLFLKLKISADFLS
jgi:hypothetical protein